MTRKFTLPTRTPTSPAEIHQLRVARQSMRMPCVMIGVMGGPNHYEAASIIERLTRVIVGIDADCTCRR